jgi:hypothetical protein
MALDLLWISKVTGILDTVVSNERSAATWADIGASRTTVASAVSQRRLAATLRSRKVDHRAMPIGRREAEAANQT